jgi:hypothetical protein
MGAHVVVEEQQVGGAGGPGPAVAARPGTERLLVAQDQRGLGRAAPAREHLARGDAAGVIDDDDADAPGGLSFERVEAGQQQGRPVARGDDHVRPARG